MNVCIVGATGFLASALGNYCNKNNIAVTAISRTQPATYKSDKFFESSLSDNDVPYEVLLSSDIIFYNAAKGVQSSVHSVVADTYFVNTYFPILLTQKLKEQNFGGTFISFGSYFEIGFNNEEKFFKEHEVTSSCLEVSNDYCISKRLLSRYFSSASFPYTNYHFILPTIYGQNENSKRLIPYLIDHISGGKKISLTSGTQVRQYLHVDDMVSLLFQFLKDRVLPGIYNFPCSQTLTIRELATIIFRYFNTGYDESIFGASTRHDEQMKNLMLDAGKFYQYARPAGLAKIQDTIASYLQNELS